jgi:hypothetical protein
LSNVVRFVRTRTRPVPPPVQPPEPGPSEEEKERRRQDQREYRRWCKEHDERYSRLFAVAVQLGLRLHRDYPFKRNSGFFLTIPGARQALWRCSDLDGVEAFLNNEPGPTERSLASYVELGIEGWAEAHQRVRKERLQAWKKIEKRVSKERLQALREIERRRRLAMS